MVFGVVFAFFGGMFFSVGWKSRRVDPALSVVSYVVAVVLFAFAAYMTWEAI